MKTIETVQKVNLLKAENDFLQRKVDILSRELRLLKEIFMAHASNAHGTQITEYDLRLLTGTDVMDMPLVPSVASSSSPSSGASVLFREAALQHLASNRASVIGREDQIRATSISSPDSFFFPSSRIYSPSSLSSRSSAHESEDDFWMYITKQRQIRTNHWDLETTLTIFDERLVLEVTLNCYWRERNSISCWSTDKSVKSLIIVVSIINVFPFSFYYLTVEIERQPLHLEIILSHPFRYIHLYENKFTHLMNSLTYSCHVCSKSRGSVWRKCIRW